MTKYVAALVLSGLSLASVAQNRDFHLDQEYAISKNGTIDLRSSDARVFITGTDRSATVRVKIDRTVTTKGWYTSKGEFTVDVEPANGNVTIHERQSNVQVGIVGYYHEDYKIVIEAPAGASLTVKGDDGDYEIKNINGSISLDIDDADAKLVNCNGNQFSFDMDDGDLEMKGGNGSVRINANDADLLFEEANFSSMDADIDDGDLVIHSSLAENGNYSIRTQDGLVVFDIRSGGGSFTIRHDDARISAQGNFNTREEDEHLTRLDLGKSTAKINIRADDASVKLRAPGQ